MGVWTELGVVRKSKIGNACKSTARAGVQRACLISDPFKLTMFTGNFIIQLLQYVNNVKTMCFGLQVSIISNDPENLPDQHPNPKSAGLLESSVLPGPLPFLVSILVLIVIQKMHHFTFLVGLNSISSVPPTKLPDPFCKTMTRTVHNMCRCGQGTVLHNSLMTNFYTQHPDK